MIDQLMTRKRRIKFFDKGHSSVLRLAQRLYGALSQVNYDGSNSFDKQLQDAKEVMRLFCREWKWYMEMEEHIILSFLQTHVPRLESQIRFFQLEHEDLKDKLKKVGYLLGELEKCEHASARNAKLRSIEDAVAYWFVHLKQHMKSEQEIVNSVVQEELNSEEQAKLEHLIESQLSGR
jgi:iron-sulfur cluster repair protein YtfE (RIC family)